MASYEVDNESKLLGIKIGGFLKVSQVKQMRKRNPAKLILLCILLAISAFLGGGFAYFQYEFTSAIKHGDVSFQDMQVDAATLYDKDIINILLIGADSREEWNDSGRSDSSMIATLDMKNGQLKLTSLMRDMYIEIPGHGKNRFNAAYKFGGVSLLNETIAHNFNIRLDGYVVVDFKAFRDVIDALGGVDITLTEKEANYLNEAYHGKIQVEVGEQTLTGKEALAYTRIRQVATATGKLNDFGRTERQRTVIDSLFSKFKTQSLGEITDILKMVLENVTTDLSNKQISSLAFSVLTISDKESKQMCVPMEGSYDSLEVVLPGTTTEAKVLEVDIEANKAGLENFIFHKYEEPSTEEGSNETAQIESDTTMEE